MVCKSSNTTDAEILTLVVRISISLPMSPRLILGTVAKIDEDNGEADEEDEREPKKLSLLVGFQAQWKTVEDSAVPADKVDEPNEADPGEVDEREPNEADP